MQTMLQGQCSCSRRERPHRQRHVLVFGVVSPRGMRTTVKVGKMARRYFSGDPSIVEYFAEHERYRCGYCGSSDTNYSHGLFSFFMTECYGRF